MDYHSSNSKPAAAAASASPTEPEPEPVPMKEWTVGAVNSLQSRSDGDKQNVDKLVCSREYLSCALKIAHSIANQLSTVEEERMDTEKNPSERNSNNNGNDDSPPVSVRKIPEKSWSEYISVNCMTKEGKTYDGDANFEPPPYDSDNSDARVSHNLAQQLSTLLDDSRNSIAIDYLDVRGAILKNEGAEDGNGISASDNGKLEMRSLGIAFYELFSGGHTTAGAGASEVVADLSEDSDEIEFKSVKESINTIGIGAGGGDDDELFGNNPAKRRSPNLDNSSQKQKAAVRPRTPSASISVEPLRLLGLPTALCDLISNMVDSVDGDNGEAYGLISDVRDDLKLMIDSPHVYLHDFDLAKATKVGLQFGSAFYGREAELRTLKECYQRSITSECEVAMICGTSGIGKSKLSREFARYVNEDGGSIFLSGRFDKLESQPLQAISSAFDKYCAWVTVGDPSTVEKVSTALKENMGEDVACLVTVMPNLATILGDDYDSNQSNKNNTAVDSQKRLRYLFCQFVNVISICHEEPLILFLDDCQWIDNASVALLNQILMMSGSPVKDHRFFFLGTCRDDEMNESHPLNVMLATVNTLCETTTTKIHLTSMSIGAVNEMVSTELSLLPRITSPLAKILHHKTKGSPLFVKQVMMELYKERLLYPSLSRRRWVWDADKILDMKMPENVAAFITNSFDRLPCEVLSALVVLSCFGASADVLLIKVLEREINQTLIVPLDDAVAHSVLGKRNGKFHFMHDKLQEAAYSKMTPEERGLNHFRFGLALGFVAVRERADRLLLSAVTQINHGGPQAVIDDDQAVVVANLNLDAGKKAMNMSDFFSAHSFFNHGISFLRLKRPHWNEHYDLSLGLFNLAAKCAFMNAEYDSLKMILQQIMHNARCFEDKLQAISIKVTLLIWSGSVSPAVELMKSTLSSLDENFPSSLTSTAIKKHLDNTKTQLAVLSDDTLLSYPAMVNPKKILAVEFLVKLYGSLSLTGERATIPIIPSMIIQICLKYGMSPHCPSAFAQYGTYLALVGDEFDEGYRYAKFALSLMKKIPSRAHDGSAIFWASHIRLYFEPMQSTIECYLDAYIASLKSGNPFALTASYVYHNYCFWSGKELNVVVVAMKDAMKEMKYLKQSLVLTLMMPIFQITLRLVGQSAAPAQQEQQGSPSNNFDFDESFNDGESENPSQFATQLHHVYFVKLSEALIFREINKATYAAEKYFSLDDSLGSDFAVSSQNMFCKRL
eukprot:scaffold33898_cov222-Skeletonema_dohrnii-CCMP3373.AAC.1